MSDAEVIAELQEGNRLFKQERYRLKEEIVHLKATIDDLNGHITTLSKKEYKPSPGSHA